jgi:hypothetical protein
MLNRQNRWDLSLGRPILKPLLLNHQKAIKAGSVVHFVTVVYSATSPLNSNTDTRLKLR